MPFENSAIEEKLQELLLNRIDTINWNYYDLDLNQGLANFNVYTKSTELTPFFDLITEDEIGKYVYQTQEGLPSIATVLKTIFSMIKLNPRLLKGVLRRLFDINEITNESESNLGLLGQFNKKDREFRNKLFKNKIREGFRREEDHVVILAEGDSWFQFPRVYLQIDPVKDILDWLIEDKKFAVCSLAAGGDWLSNIFHSGEYIEQLPKVSPDVFLLSGGGNDLVGNNRLAIMVINPRMEDPKRIEDHPALERLFQMRMAKDPNLDSDKYFTWVKLYLQ